MLSQHAVRVNFFQGGTKVLELEVDEIDGFSAERRLWCAVIISTVDEYAEWCRRIQNYWNIYQRPVDKGWKMSLAQIRRQCSTDWFRNICDLADFNRDRVLAKFDEMDREHAVDKVPFEGEDRYISQWAIRKMRRRRVI